jgi:hypothetical protein
VDAASRHDWTSAFLLGFGTIVVLAAAAVAAGSASLSNGTFQPSACKCLSFRAQFRP